MNDLPPISRKFILHWGEMGVRWGINRTMAQIHALLYLSEKPLHAEEICETLGLARSNVSVALRELQGWGIVKVVHLMGDRRDHFESMKDVLEMFRVIMRERQRREVDPTLSLIKDCLAEAGHPKAGSGEAVVRERLEAMKEFFELSASFAAQVERVPTGALLKVLRMGEKLCGCWESGEVTAEIFNGLDMKTETETERAKRMGMSKSCLGLRSRDVAVKFL